VPAADVGTRGSPPEELMQVLQLVAGGCTQPEIAAALRIAKDQVHQRQRQLRRWCRAHTMAECVATAFHRGWLRTKGRRR